MRPKLIAYIVAVAALVCIAYPAFKLAAGYLDAIADLETVQHGNREDAFFAVLAARDLANSDRTQRPHHERLARAYAARDDTQCTHLAYSLIEDILPDERHLGRWLELARSGCPLQERDQAYFTAINIRGQSVRQTYNLYQEYYQAMAAAPEEAFNENDSGSYGQPKLEALNRIAVGAAYWALDAGEYDAARNLIARHRDDDLRFNNESFGSLAGQLAFHEDDFDKALAEFTALEHRTWSNVSALRPILGELQLDFVVAHLEAHDVKHGEPSYILDALISSRMWATAALIKTGGTASVQPHLRDLDVMLTYHLSEYGAPQGAWGYSDVLMTEWMAYAYRNALLDRCAVRHALGRENAEVDCEAAELITLDIDMIRDAEPRSAYFANSTQTP